MKKVILIIPPQEKFHKDYLPSIGIGYLASSLEKANYEVGIIDSYAEGLDDEETIKKVLEEKPDVVGVTATSHNRFHAISICKEIKRKSNNQIFVVVGGCHFSPTAISTLDSIPEIDVVIQREGELTFVDLLNHYFQNKPFDDVLGIVFRKGRRIITTRPRSFVKNLDELPMPAWHLFNLERYNAKLEGEEETRSIGVMSSRGCPNECVFCANSSFWQRLFRRHSPKKFIDEVEFLYKNNGYHGFDFWDDTITIMRSHIEEICQEILKRKLDIVWYARARVNTVDKNLLILMRKAGCKVISFGVESGSPRILKNIKKHITIEQVKKVVKICADLKYIVKLFFMYSLPGETLDDIEATRNLMLELKFYGPNIHVLPGFTFIYPGTVLEEIAKKEEILEDFDWNIPVKFDINEKIGVNPTIPLYEQESLSVEEIKSFLDSGITQFIELAKSISFAIKGVRDFNDIHCLFKRGSSYLKRRIPPFIKLDY